MALESGGQMDPRQWQTVRLGGSGGGGGNGGMTLGPGMTFTLCANNTIAPTGATMTYTGVGGDLQSQSVAELRRRICDGYFVSTIAFDGDDPYYLFVQRPEDLQERHIDSWGELPGARVSACGSTADPETGYLFTRAPRISAGAIVWADSSSGDSCEWNSDPGHADIDDVHRGLELVTPGFHCAVLPVERWTWSPVTTEPSRSPTSSAPSAVPSSSEPTSTSPTTSPITTLPTTAPSHSPTAAPASSMPTAAPTGSPVGVNLFISEVFNGGPRRLQYVEVYNPNPEPIDFSAEQWVLQTLVNPTGQAAPEFREILLAGHVLGPGMVHTVCVDSTSSESICQDSAPAGVRHL